MRTDDQTAPRRTAGPVAPAPGEAPGVVLEPARVHFVVVSTRAVNAGERAPAGAVLQTRFWHPRDQRWSENFFESLDHAVGIRSAVSRIRIPGVPSEREWFRRRVFDLYLWAEGAPS